MKNLPNDKILNELLEMGKDYEAQARKLYATAEAFSQKYEQRLHEAKDNNIVAPKNTKG